MDDMKKELNKHPEWYTPDVMIVDEGDMMLTQEVKR